MKHLLITSGDEDNIGVLQFMKGQLNDKNIKERIVKPIREHFDCDFAVTKVEMKRDNPFRCEVTGILDIDGDTYERIIYLDQTWMY